MIKALLPYENKQKLPYLQKIKGISIEEFYSLADVYVHGVESDSISTVLDADFEKAKSKMNDAQKAFVEKRLDATKHYLWGGQGTGKTTIIAYLIGIFASEYPMLEGVFVAPTEEQMNKNILPEIRDYFAKEFGWHEYDPLKNPNGVYVESKRPPRHFIQNPRHAKFSNGFHFINGSVFSFVTVGDGDNSTVLESTNPDILIADELQAYPEYLIVNSLLARARTKRIRLNDGHLGAITFLLSVPPVENIKKEFFVSLMDGIIYHKNKIENAIRSAEHGFYYQTILENPYSYFDEEMNKQINGTIRTQVLVASAAVNRKNLVPGYIEKREIETGREAESRVHGNIFGKSGNVYFTGFDEKYHVLKRMNWSPDEKHCGQPIYLTFDFNNKPYITLLCARIISIEAEYTKIIRNDIFVFEQPKITLNSIIFFDEICLEHPNSHVSALVDELAKREWVQRHKGAFIICGDPSGKSGSFQSIDKRNTFELIQAMLTGFEKTKSGLILDKRAFIDDAVYAGAESLHNSNNFFNSILDTGTRFFETVDGEKYQLFIAPNCINLIADLKTLPVDKNGLPNKRKYLGKDKEELFGHCADAARYLILVILLDTYRKIYRQ